MILNLYLVLQLSFLALNNFTGLLAQCDVSYFKNESLMLNTLNGKILGACSKVDVNDLSNPNLTDYYISWKSVPYAQPPINENRFKKPVPVKSWSDVKDGTKWPNTCIQTSSMRIPGQSSSKASEDCLYLNIFVSAKSFMKYKNDKREKKPILIFIHGGRFIMGSSLTFDPSINIALQDVIYVTINYRLGPFGFMHLAGSDIAGNQGFLDQHVALKWVYENADSFGGDRNRITVSGQSAGSFSTSYHLVYKPSWPYFKSVIMESGSLLYSTMELFSSSELTRRTKAVMKNSGCDFDALSQVAFKTCIQNVNSSTIVSETDNFSTSSILKGISLASELNPTFQLVLDGVDFKEPIKTSIRNRRFKRANFMSGFTTDEAAFQIPTKNVTAEYFKKYLTDFYTYYPRYPTLPTNTFVSELINEYTKDVPKPDYFKLLTQVLSEEIFICPTIHLAEIYSERNNVYVFNFNQTSPTSMIPGYGVVHGDDVDYVFGTPMSKVVSVTPFGSRDPRLVYSDADRQLSKQIVFYWTNFIKYDNPNVNLAGAKRYTFWPTFTNRFSQNLFGLHSSEEKIAPSNEKKHMVLNGNSSRVATEFIYYQNIKRHCNFWKAYENL